MDSGNTSRNSEGSSRSDSGKSEGFDCEICGDNVSRQGAHGHLRFAHDLDSERASELIQADKAEKELEAGKSSSASMSGSGGDGGRSETSQKGLTDMGETVAHVRQRVEDVSDAKAAMKLLDQLDDDGGDDRDSAEIAELRGEVRALRSQMSEPADSTSGSGGSGDIGKLVDMASNGDVNPDTVGKMASAMGLANPEVKRQEIEFKKQNRRIEHREELIGTVFQKVEEATEDLDGSLFSTLVEGLFSGRERERRSEATVEPRRGARGDRGGNRDQSLDGPEEGGEAVKSSAQAQFEEMTESDGGEEGEREIDDEE